VKLVANHPKEGNFIAMHPIAGTETFLTVSILAGLPSKGNTNIICKVERTSFPQVARKALIF
jgi:prephenate dehydrogenase